MSVSTQTTSTERFDVGRLCRHFSELSPQAMVVVEGPTHIVRYLNAAFERLAGRSRADMIGRPFAEAVPEGQNNDCLVLLDKVYRTGTPEKLPEQEHGDLPFTYWSYLMWAVVDEERAPVGVMIQITDATEIASFRNYAMNINQQLLISGTRQHELVEVAESANRTKDEFLATLGHELRTPLAVILLWSELLGNPLLDPENSLRAVEVIKRNAKIQSHLVDDLMDVSRIITGQMRLDVQSVDLSAIIIDSVDGLRLAAKAKEIALRLEMDSAASRLSGDETRLQQVVWNLLSNALKFTPQGGRVTVRLARVDSNIELTVTDTGKGIAPEFLPHVFDRFRQEDSTSTRAFGGLGLGLAIVRQLVELHGGTVQAHSEGLGQGATFTVILPQVPDEKASEPSPLSP